MKFLIDSPLSPSLAAGLRESGFDAIHVRDIELQGADDLVVFRYAASEERTIVSADTDFGTLLALRRDPRPSVIIFRRGTDRKPAKQLTLLLANMPAIEAAITKGAVIVFEDVRIRVRHLPIGGAD